MRGCVALRTNHNARYGGVSQSETGFAQLDEKVVFPPDPVLVV